MATRFSSKFNVIANYQMLRVISFADAELHAHEYSLE